MCAERPIKPSGDPRRSRVEPIEVTLGASAWETSLPPKGDGTHFTPLEATIREAEEIDVGDRVSLSFTIRNRR